MGKDHRRKSQTRPCRINKRREGDSEIVVGSAYRGIPQKGGRRYISDGKNNGIRRSHSPGHYEKKMAILMYAGREVEKEEAISYVKVDYVGPECLQTRQDS